MSTDRASATGAYSKIMRDPDLALFLTHEEEAGEERPERYAGWDVAQWCRLGVYEGEHGLHLSVSTRDKDYVRAVTVEQIEHFATNLRWFAATMRDRPRPVASDDSGASGGAR